MNSYKRVILKISGESLLSKNNNGIDHNTINDIAKEISFCAKTGVEIAVVIGGGNFWRGRNSKTIDRTRSDHMGMLATVINSLALLDYLEQNGVEARVESSIEMRQIAEPYIRLRALRHLNKKRVVIFACGTGNPFFSTDTAAALRAAEIGADIILLAKNIDGVYDCDPRINKSAIKYLNLNHIDIINSHLEVMDSTAASLCMDNKIPIMVFSVKDPKNITKVIHGETVGTLIS